MNDKTKELLASAACVLIGAVTLLLGFFLGSRDKQPVTIQPVAVQTNYVYLPLAHTNCVERAQYCEAIAARDWQADLVKGLVLKVETIESLLCIQRDREAGFTNRILQLEGVVAALHSHHRDLHKK